MIDQWIECTRRSRILLGILLATKVAAAALPPASAAGRTQVISQGNRYLLAYHTHPAPIPLNKPFELFVSVRERYKKSPARKVSIAVDAGMSAHNHGMFTRPEVIRADAGEFHVTGMLFHMIGEWNLTFVLHRGLLKDKVTTAILVN